MSEFDRPPLPSDWKPEHVRALRRAAEQDDPDALVTLGEFLYDGLHRSDGTVLVRRDARKAKQCFERAARLGSPEGMCALADYLSRGRASSSQLSRAEALYRESFRNGHTTAAYNLACTYQNLGRHRDAVAWYRRAYDAGDSSALLQIALAELYGIGTKRAPNTALAKLQRVARSRTRYWPESTGDQVQSMLVIAQALLDGWLLPRNYNEAYNWLRRAAKRNSAVAKARLDELDGD